METVNNPKISVIIPIYNCELYLHDTFKAIQQQNFADFECICVNDGSTDKSEEIIDIFSKNDSRFKKISKANGGLSSARNAGLDVATGEFIYIMDADDLIPTYTLNEMLKTAEKYDADIVRGRNITVAENFKLEELPKENTAKKELYYDKNLPKNLRKLAYGNFNYVWMYLFRHASIKNIRFEEELKVGAEDRLFMFDVIGKVRNFVQTDAIIYCYRRSKTSDSFNFTGLEPRHLKKYEFIVHYIYPKYALDKNVDNYLRKWVYSNVSYDVFRSLIRSTIRRNSQLELNMTRDFFLKLKDTPEFDEIIKRWSFEKRIFYNLFINGKFNILKKLSIFMW